MTDWTEWHPHTGKGCPVPAGVWAEVEVYGSDGRWYKAEGPCRPTAAAWTWANFGRTVQDPVTGKLSRAGKVVRYRTRRYAAADLCMSRAVAAAGKVNDKYEGKA